MLYGALSYPQSLLSLHATIKVSWLQSTKGSSKEPMVMHLLRCLWFFSAFFYVTIYESHIPGVLNNAADMLYRDGATQFLRSHPQASHRPTQVPTPLLHIISPKQLDWTSCAFLHHFNRTISIVRMYSHSHKLHQ